MKIVLLALVLGLAGRARASPGMRRGLANRVLSANCPSAERPKYCNFKKCGLTGHKACVALDVDCCSVLGQDDCEDCGKCKWVMDSTSGGNCVSVNGGGP